MRQFVWIAVVLLCFSCGTDASRIGLDFFKEGALDVSYIDSASVKLSTVRFDSLITSGEERILLGSAKDSRLGRITALSYLQFGVESAVDLADTKISFDYLAVVLVPDGYAYYDTTTLQTLKAHAVLEDIEPETGTSLYNTTDFKTNPAPLGSVTFIPRPNQADTVEIKLSQAYGQSFFLKAQAGDEAFESTEEFIEYFRGLAIVPDSTGTAGIMGFGSAVSLRLYYYDRNEVPVERKYISFPVTANASTHIVVNRENSNLKKLTSYNKRLSADETGNEAYIQSGAGLAMRVDMPYLRDLKQYTNFYMTQAVLEVYPVRKSYSDLSALPGSLTLYLVDKRNDVYSASTFTALLNEDVDLQRDTRYVADITAFVKSQMELQAFNENALLFMLPDVDFRLGAGRVYFHSRDHEYQTRLRIYYATINE